MVDTAQNKQLPKRIIFFNLPLHGHINPSLKLIRELTKRDYEVHYFATELFREKIEGNGAIFREYPKSMQKLELFLSGNWIDAITAVYGLVEEQTDDLVQLANEIKPDLIFHDFMSPWGKIVADHLQYPIKTVSIYATFMMRTELIPWMKESALNLPIHIWRRKKQTIQAVKTYQKIRSKFNLSIPFLKALATDGDINFIFTSREFHPAGNLIRNPKYVFLGNLESAKKSFKKINGDDPKKAKPLVYASLGTLYNDNPQFFENVVQAFSKDFSGELILSLGGQKRPNWRIHHLIKSHPNMKLLEFAPQLEILERADVFITHGGMNSASEASLFHVPMINCPQQQEQKMVSSRVAKLGAGIDLKTKSPSPEKIRKAYDHIIKKQSYKYNAMQLGTALEGSTNLNQAAEMVDQLLAPNQLVFKKKFNPLRIQIPLLSLFLK